MVSDRLLVILGVLLIVMIVVRNRYSAWKNGLLATLKDGVIATTTLGEIEYKLAGEGPTILVLHGGPVDSIKGSCLNI